MMEFRSSGLSPRKKAIVVLNSRCYLSRRKRPKQKNEADVKLLSMYTQTRHGSENNAVALRKGKAMPRLVGN